MMNLISRITFGAIMLVIGLPVCILCVLAQFADQAARPYRSLDQRGNLVMQRPHILIYAPAKFLGWLLYFPTVGGIALLAIVARIALRFGLIDERLFS